MCHAIRHHMALRRIPYTHADDGYSLIFIETVSLPKQEGCRQVLWALSAKGKAGFLLGT